MFLRIRLQSHQVHLTMLQYYTCVQNNTYTKMNLSTVKWAQWDKTQSRELLVLFICVCTSLCTLVAHNTAQNRPDNFPLALQTITTAPMMSIWGKGGIVNVKNDAIHVTASMTLIQYSSDLTTNVHSTTKCRYFTISLAVLSCLTCPTVPATT